MKRGFVLILFLYLTNLVFGQETYKITYHYFRDGAMMKQDPVVVFATKGKSFITKESLVSGSARYPAEVSSFDYSNKKVYRIAYLSASKQISTEDSTTLTKYAYEEQGTGTEILKHKTKKAVTSVNSNKIELLYSNDLSINAAPNDLGQGLGLVLEYRRNGNSGLVAASIEKLKAWPKELLEINKADLLDELAYRDKLWKSRFVHIPIFQNEQN